MRIKKIMTLLNILTKLHCGRSLLAKKPKEQVFIKNSINTIFFDPKFKKNNNLSKFISSRGNCTTRILSLAIHLMCASDEDK